MTFCFYFTKIGIQIYFHSGSSVMISISSNFVIWKSGSNYIYPFINLSVVSTILRGGLIVPWRVQFDEVCVPCYLVDGIAW